MFHSCNINKKRGFSMVELMIAVTIFGILSTVAVSSYANFNNRIGVDTLAHQIAQFGHEAQVSALSVKRSVNGTYPAYGIHFNMATNTKMIFYADVINPDLRYTPNGSCGLVTDECEKTINLLKGVTVKALCVKVPAGGVNDDTNCKHTDVKQAATVFDIAFKRPSPDAIITGATSTVTSNVPLSAAQVVISSNKGYSRTVTFYVTGQIAVR